MICGLACNDKLLLRKSMISILKHDVKKNVINAVLRKAKKLRWELGHEKGSDERAAKEGYVKGARVSHDLGEGDVGTVVEIHGRSVWIAWDEYPNLPVQYASPWHFSLIDTFSEEGPNG